MKIIFLDFDGVLNSAASFLYEDRKRSGKGRKHRQSFCPVNETLCHVCTSNFKHILDQVQNAQIVISSSWRTHYDLDWLRAKLEEYGIDGKRVIDKTPVVLPEKMSMHVERGVEIKAWLDAHPEVTNFVILDDNYIGPPFQDNHIDPGPNFVKSHWNVGLTLPLAVQAVKILGGKDKSFHLRLE
jgi:hypothetical protein